THQQDRGHYDQFPTKSWFRHKASWALSGIEDMTHALRAMGSNGYLNGARRLGERSQLTPPALPGNGREDPARGRGGSDLSFSRGFLQSTFVPLPSRTIG